MRNVQSLAIRAAISLVLSAALWAFVSFSENPNQTKNFDDLPVTVEGVPPRLVMVNESGLPISDLPHTADVTVVAPLEIFTRVTRSSLQPFIDLSNYESGTHNVPVQVRPNQPQLRISSLDPERVPVRLEREISKTVPLLVQLMGEPPFSYEARTPQVRVAGEVIEQVSVRGPASQMQRVAQAQIEIDINGQTNTIQAQRQPLPVDSSGLQVAGVTVIPENVELRVPIASSAGIKRVPVLAKWRGVPADGYALLSITPSPSFVEIVGRSAILDTLSFVETTSVDIGGASSSFTTTARLLVPDGVALSNPGDSEVQVGVTIEPVDLNFSLSLHIPVAPRNQGAGLAVVFEPQLLLVALSGSAQSLKALRPGDLEAVIDLQGLGPGTHVVTPQLDLPPGLTLESDLTSVEVTVRAVATVTPVPATPQPATPEVTGTEVISPTVPVTTPLTPTPEGGGM